MPIGTTIQYDFTERNDKQTGRTWRQLTSGPGYTYPLYFFGDVVTPDGQTLIYYHWLGDEVQNWKLDLTTGLATQLTAATTGDCHHWRLIGHPHPERGVYDQYSTLNPVTSELLYFTGGSLRAVHLDTLNDRLVHELPEDRAFCAIPGVSPDGKHLAIIHADREWWEGTRRSGLPKRWDAKGCSLDVIELANGERRNVLVMNAWLSHANFYDNETIVFANPPTECGLYVTPIDGGHIVQLCPQDTKRWQVNHYLMTARGIQYETVSPGAYGVMGEVDPHTYAYRDYRTDVPIAHRGRDPEGLICFGDSYHMEPPHDRFICWFPELHADRLNPHELLTEDFQTYGVNAAQHSHLHPFLMPDRRHLLFTGPDQRTQTNHMFLLDIADLADRETAVERDPRPTG